MKGPLHAYSWALRKALELKLVEERVGDDRTEEVLGLEPQLGDSWLAYWALAPATVILDLL
jgi:hypothetical protein